MITQYKEEKLTFPDSQAGSKKDIRLHRLGLYPFYFNLVLFKSKQHKMDNGLRHQCS